MARISWVNMSLKLCSPIFEPMPWPLSCFYPKSSFVIETYNVVVTFQIHLKINGGRSVEGVLRGFDPFMNLVLDESIEFTKSGERNNIGMTVIRGNSIVMLEAKDRI